MPNSSRQRLNPVGYQDRTSKVVRGGSHNVHLQTLRSASRSSALPTDKHCLLGFREPFTLYHINGICTDGKWSKLAMSFRSSTDGGATWTEAVMMKAKTDAFHLDSARNQPQGNVLVTASGNFLAFADGALPGGSGSSVNCSDDGGKTWSVRGLPGPPGIHVAAVELADGRLLAFSRESSGRRGSLPKSWSADQGRTWAANASEFPPVGTVQRVELLRLDSSDPSLAPTGAAHVPLLLISFANRGMPGRDANGQDAVITGAFAAEGSAQLARPVARAIRDALEDRRHRSAADGAR